MVKGGVYNSYFILNYYLLQLWAECVTEELSLDAYLNEIAKKMHKVVGSILSREEVCEQMMNIPDKIKILELDFFLTQLELKRRNPKSRTYAPDIMLKNYIKSVDNPLNMDRMIDEALKLNVGNKDLWANYKQLENEDRFRKYFFMSWRMIDMMEENPTKSFFFSLDVDDFFGDFTIQDFIKVYAGYKVERVSNKK